MTARYLFFCFLLVAATAAGAAVASEWVLVADPYIELHTGAGRGFPVFHVTERGRWLEILKRRTDWFKVRAENGKEGWVHRAQLENTLTEAGVKMTFRDVLVDDYLARRFELGFAGGRFAGDPLMIVRGGVRMNEYVLAELSLAQATGSFSTTTVYAGNLVSQPFPDWTVSPFFTLGVGHFRNEPRATLVQAAEASADEMNVGIGVRAYLTRRFIFRIDYRDHVVLIDENRTDEYREWSAGFSFFF